MIVVCKECGDEIESGKRRTCWKCERDKKQPRREIVRKQSCGHCLIGGHNIRTCHSAMEVMP